MTDLGVITRGHVLAATAECDRLGKDEFLSQYGFGRAREYLLVLNGRDYDSKAIVGVAHRYATGRALEATEFSGGRSGAAKILDELGFDVSGTDEFGGHASADDGEAWQDAAEVGIEASRAAWALAARDGLLDVARRYHAVITYKELAALVQWRTRIRTTQLVQHWIGDVLTRVAVDCFAKDEPNLSALVRQRRRQRGGRLLPGGRVGDGRTPRRRGPTRGRGAPPLPRLPRGRRAAGRRRKPCAHAPSRRRPGPRPEGDQGGDAGADVPVVLHGDPRDGYLRQLRLVPRAP